MSAVKNRDTKAELALRRALHASGVRYRLQAKDVVGRPDLVIRKYRIAVFVDGDMWHGNEHIRRGLPTLQALFPTNTDFWCNKILRNIDRDREVNERLTTDGWIVLRFWATDIESDPEAIARHVKNVVDRSRQTT